MESYCYHLPAGIFVSEQSLLQLADKLGVSEEISARLKSSQSEGEVRIVEGEQEIQSAPLENSLFRKQVNKIRKMLSFFGLM